MEKWEGPPSSGVESVQGRRPTMEDTHVMIDEVKKEFPELNIGACSYYGVYDGHGGKEAAVLCQELLHKKILLDPAFLVEETIETAIQNGFASADKEILEVSSKESWKSGSTVVISIIVKNHLYVANCGDSEAVIGKRTESGSYEPILLSKKHKPSDQSEKDRIKKAGGHVVFGRVMGSLAVARALGDRDFKYPYNKADADFVSSEPYIAKVPIEPEFEFLIVSCDGLWDKMSYEAAVEFVAQCKKEGKPASEAAQLLVSDSLEKGTLDNVTAIIVYFPTKKKHHKQREKKREKNDEKNDEKKHHHHHHHHHHKDKKREKVDEKKKPDTGKHEEKKETPAPDLEGELMDIYEFLAQEKIRNPQNGDLSELHVENSPRAADKLKSFDLPQEEELLAEFGCMLERKILYQGVLLVTPNHLCFYSSFPGKKNKSKISVKDIQCIEKTKSLIVASAIKITTKDGKKHLFNWKQNILSRDQAFTKLLELIDHQKEVCIHPEGQHEHSEESNDEKKSESDSSSEEETEPKTLGWSRFND